MAFQFSTEFLGVVLTAQVAFSKRSWPYVPALAIPWLMMQGQRTLTKLRSLAPHARSLSSYYRFLSDGKFRLEVFWKCLFELIVTTFQLDSIRIVADDTLCPKWGHRIFGTGCHFDHVARPRPGFIWGHNWIVLSIVVWIRSAPVALPFWVQLYRPERTCSRGEFRTRLEIVAEAMKTVRRWTFRPIELVADGAYNNASLIAPLQALGIPLVSRLRADAVLRDARPPALSHRRGRPPRHGAALPKLSAIARARTGWREVRVHIYRANVTLKVKVIDAWWPACESLLRVVIVKDPTGKHRTCYLSSTDLAMSAEAIIEIFSQRWSIEQLFSDVKTHLGLDSAEVRAERSVIRHAALSFGFATWVHVWHYLRSPRGRRLTVAPQRASFRSKLTELRTDAIKRTIFSSRVLTARSARKSNALAALFSRTVAEMG
jgi:hypothetical protein